MTVKTVIKTSTVLGREVTVKTYPGLFGEFLDWVKAEGQPSSHDTVCSYIKEQDLDKDQASWLFGIIRRAVNDGMLSDRWWD